nr:MAG TPA: hypothetical protein [Caudoviricetes sp.]
MSLGGEYYFLIDIPRFIDYYLNITTTPPLLFRQTSSDVGVFFLR